MLLAFGFLLAYLAVAYFAIPTMEIFYAHRHPALNSMPGITYTGDDHPGDPINVTLIGSEADLKKIMLEAGWFPADPITMKSSLEIAEGTILKRPYEHAPVSSLYLWGRKQDLAFEKPVGNNPRQRHHVRFWRSTELDDEGRPAWAGAVTFDVRVGFSHATGEITHHIDPDVDAERDHLFDDLEKTGDLHDIRVIPGFHAILAGRNGGNDPWYTDGSLYTAVVGGPDAVEPD